MRTRFSALSPKHQTALVRPGYKGLSGNFAKVRKYSDNFVISENDRVLSDQENKIRGQRTTPAEDGKNGGKLKFKTRRTNDRFI